MCYLYSRGSNTCQNDDSHKVHNLVVTFERINLFIIVKMRNM